MDTDEEAQAAALATAEHLELLVRKRDRIEEAIGEASAALVAQVARTRWSRAQMVWLWEMARSAKVKYLSTGIGRIPLIKYQILECGSRAEARQLEADLIFQHKPPYNTAGVQARGFVSAN